MNVTLRLQAIGDRDDAPSIQAILSSQASLEEAGFVSLLWSDLASGRDRTTRSGAEPTQGGVAVQGSARTGVPAVSKVSWTSSTLRKRCFAHKGTHWRPRFSLPVDRMCRIESQSFRILLLRRLRGRLFDTFGHHWSACLVAGVLGEKVEVECEPTSDTL